MVLRIAKYVKYLSKILNAICIVDSQYTIENFYKPVALCKRVEATGISTEVYKERAICKLYWKILILVLFKY